jgi:hypothetical protein
MKAIAVLLFFGLTFTPFVFSQQLEDVVYLKNGSIIRGIIIEQVPNTSLKIKTRDGSVFAYKMEEVEKMTREAATDEWNFSESNLGKDGFRSGKFLIGLKAGYGDWGSVTYGANFEYGLSNYFGLALDAAYTSWDESYNYGTIYGDTTRTNYSYKYEYSLVGLLLSLSYHFTPGKKLDFYVKGGAGYFFIDASTKWTPRTPSGYYSTIKAEGSGVGYGGQVGINYFFSKNIGASLSSGWPFYASGGVTFKF